jgi:hypothetical protein
MPRLELSCLLKKTPNLIEVLKFHATFMLFIFTPPVGCRRPAAG